jgi:hypothetical protein
LETIRNYATYSNVVASLALFTAIGGTSYAAIVPPRDSVGDRQIKSRAVGADELRRGAVGSRALRNGAVDSRDLSKAAKESLAGAPGPEGPPGPAAITLRAASNAFGGLIAGNATGSETVLPNKRLIDFSRSIDGCVPVATISRNGGGPADPAAGRVVVGIEGSRVAVETYSADGTPEHLPFNVIVAC